MKILGYNYRLIEDGDADMIGAFGRFHAAHLVLQIAEGLEQQQRVSSILHEILEALNYHLELGMPHNARMALEASLYQVFVDNNVDLSPLTRELDNALTD